MRFRLLCFAVFTFPLAAQVDRATLNGTVTDESGAIVPQAKISISAPATGFQRATVANQGGGYNIPGLPIGTFNVTVSHPGFQTVELRGLTLAVGEVRTFDPRLKIGTLTTTVEVQGTAAEVNRTSAEIGGVVAAQQVRSLPLNGRNWADLMALAPGAIDAGSGGGSDQRNIR